MTAAFIPDSYKEIKIPAKKVTTDHNFNIGGEFFRLPKKSFHIGIFKEFSRPGIIIAYVLS
jgi:hypothetical protein